MANKDKKAPVNKQLKTKTSFWSEFPIIFSLICTAIPAAAGVACITMKEQIVQFLTELQLEQNLIDAAMIALPAICFVLALVVLIKFIYSACKDSNVKYELRDCMLFEKKGKKRDVCKLILKPGMSVYYEQRSLKARFFGYATIIINTGVGDNTAIVTMNNVKRFKASKATLDHLIKENCSTYTRTMVVNL